MRPKPTMSSRISLQVSQTLGRDQNQESSVTGLAWIPTISEVIDGQSKTFIKQHLKSPRPEMGGETIHKRSHFPTGTGKLALGLRRVS